MRTYLVVFYNSDRRTETVRGQNLDTVSRRFFGKCTLDKRDLDGNRYRDAYVDKNGRRVGRVTEKFDGPSASYTPRQRAMAKQIGRKFNRK